MKNAIIFSLLSVILLIGCRQDEKLVQEQDYLHLIQQDEPVKKAIAEMETDIQFWANRLQRDTGN
ncbi:MAG: hypothetical protein JNN29_09755, partial [Chitinophagaceae bacterium]|nr:hypothetical protein [Chitinophagaceae bacterium]